VRTRAEVRNELDDLHGAITVFDDTQAESSAFGMQLMRAALERRHQVLVHELRLVEEADLVMVLDGPQVLEGSVDVDFLVKILQPFEKAVASIAQALEDAATRAGLIPATIRDLATVRLKTTFAGSFGMALAGPPPSGDLFLPIFDEPARPLFDRAVSRLLAVVEAGLDPDDFEQNIIEEVSDLGQRSVSHLSELARVAGGAGAPVEFHWADPGEAQRRVVLSSLVASRLQRVLTHIESSDEQIPIVGRLVEASLPRRTFGIQVEDDEIIRGSVSADVAHRIEDYFGKEVRGSVLVTRTVSTTSDKHAEKFTLLDFAGPLGE
jgi:hypothetical protein